jgi:hypothetical protein
MQDKLRTLSRNWLGILITLTLLQGSILVASTGLPAASVQAEAEAHPAPQTIATYGAAAPSLQSANPSTPESLDSNQTLFLPLIARKYTPVQSVFGVQMTAINDSRGLQEAVAARAAMVRATMFLWSEIEPVRTNPPTYHWEAVDEAGIINAAQNRMTLIAGVQSTPTWAQKIPGYYCGPVRQDNLDEFAQFLQALVDRYSGSPYYVRHWELWNEPDLDPFAFMPPLDPESEYGCWGDSSDPSGFGGGYYATMLKTAFPAIKAADPNAKVLVGGLLLDCDPRDPPPGKDCHSSNFLEGIVANGGGPYFDMVSFHAYTYYAGLGFMGNPNWSGSATSIPPKTAFLQSVLGQYGFAGKPLVNTEAALLCPGNTSDCLETQAMYIPRAYAEAMALGLAGQTYYRMINVAWYFTGLLWPALYPKPGYYAYATASAFLSGLEYEHPAQGYPAKISGYAFFRVDRAQDTDVIWSSDGSAVTVSLPPGATAYDRYGEIIGSGMISVDYSPVYVVKP